MDFSGRYELQSQENMEPFLSALGCRLLDVLIPFPVLLVETTFMKKFQEIDHYCCPGGSVTSNARILTGIPDDEIEQMRDLKSITKIVQNGEDFIVAIETGNWVLVNNFTLGHETQVETPAGERVKAIMNLEGENKLVVNTKDMTSVAEFNGDLLINTVTLAGIVYKRISKKN